MFIFYPVSLKQKKPTDLIADLKSKQVKLVIDPRRKNSRTAPYFNPQNIEKLLNLKSIDYLYLPQLGNYKFFKTSAKYLNSVQKELREIQQSAVLTFDFKSKLNIAILCYCTAKDQSNNNCHASWLARHLFDVCNQPLIVKIKELIYHKDSFDDEDFYFEILSNFPGENVHHSEYDYSQLIDVSEVELFIPNYFKEYWKYISDYMFNEGIIYEVRPNIISIDL